jgi:hypothetical protein
MALAPAPLVEWLLCWSWSHFEKRLAKRLHHWIEMVKSQNYPCLHFSLFSPHIIFSLLPFLLPFFFLLSFPPLLSFFSFPLFLFLLPFSFFPPLLLSVHPVRLLARSHLLTPTGGGGRSLHLRPHPAGTSGRPRHRPAVSSGRPCPRLHPTTPAHRAASDSVALAAGRSYALRRLKDRLGDQRGGSEWEPIKNLLEGD